MVGFELWEVYWDVVLDGSVAGALGSSIYLYYGCPFAGSAGLDAGVAAEDFAVVGVGGGSDVL